MSVRFMSAVSFGRVTDNGLGLGARAGNRSTKAELITNVQLKNYC